MDEDKLRKEASKSLRVYWLLILVFAYLFPFYYWSFSLSRVLLLLRKIMQQS